MCDAGSNKGKKVSRGGPSVARGGLSGRGRGRGNSGRGGGVASSGTGVRRPDANKDEGTGDHPKPVMKVVVDPNEKLKPKDLSQTTIRRDSSNKVSASLHTDGSGSKNQEMDSMTVNERRPPDNNSDSRAVDGRKSGAGKIVSRPVGSSNEVDRQLSTPRRGLPQSPSTRRKRAQTGDTSPNSTAKKKRRVSNKSIRQPSQHGSQSVRSDDIVVVNDGSQSARSGRTQKGKNSAIAGSNRVNTSRTDSTSIEDLKTSVEQLKGETAQMKDILVKILEKMNTSPIEAAVKSEVVEVPVTPKRKYEDEMKNRLPKLDQVFSLPMLRFSLLKVVPRYIISAANEENGFAVQVADVPKIINALTFAVHRESKGPITSSPSGQAAAIIRRSVILDVIRDAQEKRKSRTFWLERRSEDDRPYLNEKDLKSGFERRERARGVNQGKDSKRRTAIANGNVTPTSVDDAEFIGWWAYGKLITHLIAARRNATAAVFENVGYLFESWWWSVADKRGNTHESVDTPDQESKELSEKIKKVSSKETLRVEWLTDRNTYSRNNLSFPTSRLGDDPNGRKFNEGLFRKVVKEETQLQLKVEHYVLVHKPVTGKAVRQRKGEKLELYCHKISLIDAAAQFLNCITGGDRSTENEFSLNYNKKALTAIVILATAFRDLIERLVFEKVTIQNSAIAQEDVHPELKKELQTLFQSFVPNDQTVGRVLSRKVWSVTQQEFDLNNLKPVRTVQLEPLTNDAATKGDDRLNGDYLLREEDVDEDKNREDDTHSQGYNSGEERKYVDDDDDDRRYDSRCPSPSVSPDTSPQPYQPPQSGADHTYASPPSPYDEDEKRDEDDDDDEEEESDDDDRRNDSDEEEEY